MSHRLFPMSRLVALKALCGLPADVQQLIFCECFPSKRRIHNKLEKQHPCLPEFTALDITITDFIHDEQVDLELPNLTPREKRWAYFRSHIFKLKLFSYPGKDSRVLVLLKADDWTYSDKPEDVQQQWEQSGRQLYWCDDCGREETGIPIRMHRGIICHTCYGSMLSMGDADENGWMEELSFGMVGF